MRNSDSALATNLWLDENNLDSMEPCQTDIELAREQAQVILGMVMKFRRMVNSSDSCQTTNCPHCLAPHLEKATAAVLQEEPVRFILPAFPGKSPNSAKVLGYLPDMAEQRALQFLNELCNRINRIYEPGAQIIICSDGRVFSDVVGIPEEHITAYQVELDRMIKKFGLENLSTFNLDELCTDKDFEQIRLELMHNFGQTLEALKEKVRRGGKDSQTPEDREAHRMYCGITRFLFEDSLMPNQTKSRTSIQKTCRVRAYEVIRRSNAWSELLAEQFPEAVRLSIHPQTCGARKLGIQLLGTQTWLTPWHGVAVDNGKDFVLMKRWEAEKLNARLVRDSNLRASHFELSEPVAAI